MPPCQTLKIISGIGRQRRSSVGQRQHVERDIAEPAAKDDAECEPDDEVVDLRLAGDRARLRPTASGS